MVYNKVQEKQVNPRKKLALRRKKLVEYITENPYLQYFIGLSGYQAVPPFVPSVPVEFRKRLTVDVLCEINEMIIEYNTPDDPTPGGGNPTEADAEGGNTRSSIVAMNVDRIYRSRLRIIFDIVLSRYTQHEFMLKLI